MTGGTPLTGITNNARRPRVHLERVEEAWRARAACRGLDAAVFYPVDEDEVEEARAICALCPVQETCLEYALANGEKLGIWGGLTEKERRRILRERRKSA